jgi:hypothetical protein
VSGTREIALSRRNAVHNGPAEHNQTLNIEAGVGPAFTGDLLLAELAPPLALETKGIGKSRLIAWLRASILPGGGALGDERCVLAWLAGVEEGEQVEPVAPLVEVEVCDQYRRTVAWGLDERPAVRV